VAKEALETLIEHLEVWALVFGAIVVIGVAGESIFGVRIWWNSRKLQAIQRTELANARARQAEAEADLLKLTHQLSQRAFTEAEEERIIGILKTSSDKPRIIVICADVSEPIIFGTQINRIIGNAGWDNNSPFPPSLSSPSWEGIILSVDDADNLPPSAKLLMREFAISGFEIAPVSRHDANPELINLKVGEKPKLKSDKK
jgi:hypothetical protein